MLLYANNCVYKPPHYDRSSAGILISNKRCTVSSMTIYDKPVKYKTVSYSVGSVKRDVKQLRLTD